MEWPHHKTKQLIGAVIHMQESRHRVPKSILRAVLGRMQFTVHATRRTCHGASRLVQAMSAWLMKARRAPCRHSRDTRVFFFFFFFAHFYFPASGLWSYDYGHAQTESIQSPLAYIMYRLGWFSGWQRHCRTCRSLHELDHQGAIYFFLFMAVELNHLREVEKFYSTQGECSYHVRVAFR